MEAAQEFAEMLACQVCRGSLRMDVCRSALFCPSCDRQIGIASDGRLNFLIEESPRGWRTEASSGLENLYAGIARIPLKYSDTVGPIVGAGNPYPPALLDLVGRAEPTEWVLECGSGNRRLNRARSLALDLDEYDLVQLRADVQSLPLRDGSVSVVVSQAAFEHLANPFAAADEIWRVLKPGGRIYIETAFMQPVHDAPSHFFNMTTWGVERVFRRFDILDIDWFGDLSGTVDWLMRAAGLRDRKSWKCRRIVRQLARLDKFVAHEDLRAIASGISLWGQKPRG